MKSQITSVIFLCISLCHAQPLKVWSKIYGGNLSDICFAIDKYNDTMLISVGRSQSTNLGNKGNDDVMICHFKPNGDLISIRTFGGPSIEQANALAKLPNGNVLIGGNSSGRGGDVSENYGLTDMWLMGYDPHRRVKIFDKNYGGSNTDQLNDILFLEPGRVMLFGNSKSTDRDLTSNRGGADVWINSVDENGLAVRSRTFGGSRDELGRRIIKAEASGGQMLLFGETESNDGDFAGLNKGRRDVFIIKMNRNLNQSFITAMGTRGDDLFGDAVFLPDGSFFMFNTVDSTGGDVTDSLKGGKDIWIVKVSNTGKKLWSKIIGGSRDDIAVKATLYNNDSEILLLCTSSSNDKDFKANYGQNDVVVMKLDTLGNILWSKNYGGNRGDVAGALLNVPHDGFYFVAQSFSTTHDLPSTNTEPPDFWTVKFHECVATTKLINTHHCVGDTVVINNKSYYLGNAVGSDTLSGRNSRGCDSIVVVDLVFNPASESIYVDSFCVDGHVIINGNRYDRNNSKDTIVLSKRSQFGCDSVIYIQLFFAPEIDISDTIIVKDDDTGSGSIEVAVTGGVPPYKYTWSNGSTTPRISNLTSGHYTLTVQDHLQCERTFTFWVGSTVSSHQSSAGSLYKLMCVNGYWYVVFSSELDEYAVLNIFDLQGKLQWTVACQAHLVQIPCPKGLSFLQVRLADGQNFIHKLYGE